MPKRKPEPSLHRLSRFTVGNDRYDREDFKKLMKEMREFKGYRDKLADSLAGDLAYDVWQDAFLSLHKVDPKLLSPDKIRPGHRVSRRVVEEMFDLPDHKDLRIWTAGDPVGAAVACNTIEPDMETLFDKLKTEQDMAQQLQELMQQLADAEQEQRDLDELIRDWTEEHPDEEPKTFEEQQKELQEKIDELREQVGDADASLEELLQQASPEIRAALRQGLQRASDAAQATSEMSQMWGMEPGELKRLSAAERMALAKRINNAKFKRVAELFGPMKRLAFSEQRRRVNYVPEEVFDVELGQNIMRLLPSELINLGDPDLELLFFKRYYEQSLLQFAMRGHERVARGGIVYVYDGSYSMVGDKEIWSKALGLTLLHIARKQKRQFVAIQFGSASEIMIHDFRDGEITPEKVLDFAEFFFGGGTNFERPLSVGLDLLAQEHDATGALKSDIVFVSDGECGVSPKFMDRWEAERKRLGFKCWGVNLDGIVEDEPMYTICNGSVATVRSLMNGESVREIFGGV